MERSAKGNLCYPAVQIAFHLKEYPLAQLIQKTVGSGSITRKRHLNAYTLTINDFSGLFLVISLLNGNMRTPKIAALWGLIDCVNHRFPTLCFEKHALSTAALLETA